MCIQIFLKKQKENCRSSVSLPRVLLDMSFQQELLQRSVYNFEEQELKKAGTKSVINLSWVQGRCSKCLKYLSLKYFSFYSFYGIFFIPSYYPVNYFPPRILFWDLIYKKLYTVDATEFWEDCCKNIANYR